MNAIKLRLTRTSVELGPNSWRLPNKLRKLMSMCPYSNNRSQLSQTNVHDATVDAQCDKLATQLSWQHLRWLMCHSYKAEKSPILTYLTCIWHPHWGWPHLKIHQDLWFQETRIPELSYCVVSLILCLSIFIKPACDRHRANTYTVWHSNNDKIITFYFYSCWVERDRAADGGSTNKTQQEWISNRGITK